MGKKGKWFSGVKNPFKSSPKDSATVKENVALDNASKNREEEVKNEKVRRNRSSWFQISFKFLFWVFEFLAKFSLP